jgi:hypothetical protein
MGDAIIEEHPEVLKAWRPSAGSSQLPEMRALSWDNYVAVRAYIEERWFEAKKKSKK